MNSIYNFQFSEVENHQSQGSESFLNTVYSEESNHVEEYASMVIARQQAQSLLQMNELGKDEQIETDIFHVLESKLCCFIEKLYHSNKYDFQGLNLKALREDSLYLTLSGNENISINMFVDEEDFESERDSNEEEIFLSYSKNGKDYITCDSISNIFSIIEKL